MAESTMIVCQPSSLTFTVQRSAPELVPPAGPTPHEFKPLSDIDDQDGLRFQMPLVFFYTRNGNPHHDRDPARVIKAALAESLVVYYPLAGRIRERHGGKLVVECTAEGALFVEAHADVALEEFKEEELWPPVPCLEELLFEVAGSTGIVDTPLLHLQVTRLKCGGFILAVRVNHCIMDASGYWQFLNAVSELARGAQLSVQPVWERHLLCARCPPRITRLHHEHNDIAYPKPTIIPPDKLVHMTFFFGPKEMSAFRRWVPPHLQSSTTFEVLSACLWRCRTISLDPDPEDVVHFIAVVNARSKLKPPLPKGYYGNVLAYPAAICTAKQLFPQNSVGYAIELINKAKAEVDDEYMRSLADLMVIKGRPRVIITPYSFQVSDASRIPFDRIDYGWGGPVYGGTARRVMGFASFFNGYKNKKGERGIVFPISLPGPAMDRFVKELHLMLAQFPGHSSTGSKSSRLPSSL